jgi:hypothetical protein
MNKSKLVSLSVILVLLATNVFTALSLFKTQKELSEAQARLVETQDKNPILDFNKLFIEKVLKATDEVDFETRLDLENQVRNLNDSEILEQWNKFVNAENQEVAQTEVKNLLEMLANKAR